MDEKAKPATNFRNPASNLQNGVTNFQKRFHKSCFSSNYVVIFINNTFYNCNSFLNTMQLKS
jgi:hypothetical protein